MRILHSRGHAARVPPAFRGVSVLLAAAAAATLRPSADAAPPAALSHPFDTKLVAAAAGPPADERITVLGRSYRLAPLPDPDASDAPWEASRVIRDPRTGADTTAFGNAFNLGNPLGSDERSSETGGSFVAPRHP